MSLLRPALVDRPYLPADAASATPAAVLVIIHYHKDKPHVFLTKRSSNLKSHTGEILGADMLKAMAHSLPQLCGKLQKKSESHSPLTR
jgi:hypothetical protein